MQTSFQRSITKAKIKEDKEIKQRESSKSSFVKSTDSLSEASRSLRDDVRESEKALSRKSTA